MFRRRNPDAKDKARGESGSLLAFLAWCLIIFLSSMTVILWEPFVQAVGRVLPGGVQGFEAFWLQWWWLFVKGWHVVEFFVLFLVAHRFMRKKLSARESIAWAALASLVWAVLDEYHQTFVDLRGGRVEDVLIDGAGIGLAVLLTLWLNRRARGQKSADGPS